MKFASINPATGETFKIFEEMSPQTVTQSIAESHRAFCFWKSQTLEERSKAMLKLSEVLLQQKSELAQLLAREMGKPITQGVADLVAVPKLPARLTRDEFITAPQAEQGAGAGKLSLGKKADDFASAQFFGRAAQSLLRAAGSAKTPSRGGTKIKRQAFGDASAKAAVATVHPDPTPAAPTNTAETRARQLTGTVSATYTAIKLANAVEAARAGSWSAVSMVKLVLRPLSALKRGATAATARRLFRRPTRSATRITTIAPRMSARRIANARLCAPVDWPHPSAAKVSALVIMVPL